MCISCGKLLNSILDHQKLIKDRIGHSNQINKMLLINTAQQRKWAEWASCFQVPRFPPLFHASTQASPSMCLCMPSRAGLQHHLLAGIPSHPVAAPWAILPSKTPLFLPTLGFPLWQPGCAMSIYSSVHSTKLWTTLDWFQNPAKNLALHRYLGRCRGIWELRSIESSQKGK